MELSESQISYSILNTRNIDNVSLIVDQEPERDEHNQRICQYLKNKDLYQDYINEQCKKLSDTQEMPIIDKTIHPGSLKSYTKLALKNWIKVFKKQKITDDFALKALLRNDTRRNVLMRMLRNK
jgi:hypothetical protein